MTTHAAALAYLDRGWSVIPVGGDKRPLIPWAEFQRRRAEPAEVESWWQHEPTAGVGIVTGALSGIVVLDVDRGTPEAFERARARVNELVSDALVLPVATTPRGGEHLFFRCPPDGLRNATHVAGLALDVRGDGGYVVAAPSPGYRWRVSPDDEEPATMPRELLAFLRGPASMGSNGKAHALAVLTDGADKGHRNESLHRLAWSLLGRGVDEATAGAILLAANAKCRPPLPDGEVDRIMRSAVESRARRSGAPVASEREVSFLTGAELDDVRGEPRWLVDSLLPGGGALAGIVGPRGSGKTWLAMRLAVSVANGRPFLGHSVPEPGGVVIVEAEGGIHAAADRLRRLSVGIAADLRELPLRLHHGPLAVDSAGSLARLREAIGSVRARLCVVDPWRYCFSGDEDRAKDVVPVLRRLREVANEEECVFLLCHHPRKAERGGRHSLRSLLDDAAGSGAFGDLADCVIGVVAEEGPGINLRARVVKQRDGEAIDLGLLRVELSPGSAVVAPADRAADSARAADLERRTRDAMQRLGPSASAGEIARAVGGRRQDALDVVRKLRSREELPVATP